MAHQFNSQYDIVYGPASNCTLAFCPVKTSVYHYRPSLGGNTAFLLLFATGLFLHTYLAIKWRTFAFGFAMVWGCVTEIIGYGGRILLWQNPFSFGGFMIQISEYGTNGSCWEDLADPIAVCITLGPTFFSAAIYLTLSKMYASYPTRSSLPVKAILHPRRNPFSTPIKTFQSHPTNKDQCDRILYLGPTHARFPPKFYYWFFIACDILSLILQACGGALSSLSSGGSNIAVDASIAGLSFQVFTLCIFIGLAIEYAVRYSKAPREQKRQDVGQRFKLFVGFLSLAVILILTRCVYRIDELSDGYSGPLVHNEGLFVGLEGVLIIVAVFCLAVAQPGPVFGWPANEKKEVEEA